MQQPESELVGGLKNGEETAFRELVNRYQGKVYNTCLGFVKREEDADDLAQEVFIEIHRSIRNFRMEASLSTWIYRIAVNKSLEFLRRKKLRNRISNLFRTDSEKPVEIPDFNHPGVLEERKEAAKVLFEAIGRLSEYQKTAYTLHKIEGLSYEQIAALMQKTLLSVQSLIHRARINLQKDLRTYYVKNML